MKQFKWLPGIASVGRVGAKIIEVFAIIASVCLLLGVIAFSVMPGNLFSMDLGVRADLFFNFGDILGEEWDPVAYNAALEEIQGENGLFWNATEEGLFATSDVPLTGLSPRSIGVLLIPVLVQTSLLAVFLHFLSKAFGALRKSVTPFSSEVCKNLKTSGILYLVLSAAPSFCSILIMLLVQGNLSISASFDLVQIFWGFVLIALAEVFQYGERLQTKADLAASGEASSENNPNAF